MDTNLVLNKHSDIDARLSEINHKYEYNYKLFRSWYYTDVAFPETGFVYMVETPSSLQAIYHNENPAGTIFISSTKNKSELGAQIFSKSKEAAYQILLEVEKWFKPKPLFSNETEIDLNFWYNNTQGPSRVRREITVPKWEDIKGNYAIDTATSLETLMSPDFRPAHGGQLLLWRGVPGTGKTYALRSLCQSWRDWCSFDYIVDADRFFSADSAYLMDIISYTEDELYTFMGDDEIETINPAKKEWKLLILEDAGELLSIDARDRVGQALSRLLNLVDGLIGQGLKLLVMITTNEDLDSLHGAVSRPGRTASLIEFDRLSRSEAEKWASDRKFILEDSKSSYNLAELFSIWEKFDHKSVRGQKKNGLGFRMIANG